MSSNWIALVEEIAGALLLFVCPVLFFLGVWLVDRRVCRSQRSASKRWFALSIFSVVVLAVFAALIQVPPSWQFSGGSGTVVAISYMVGLGWLTVPFLSVLCIIVGICGGIISHVITSRRRSATPEV